MSHRTAGKPPAPKITQGRAANEAAPTFGAATGVNIDNSGEVMAIVTMYHNGYL